MGGRARLPRRRPRLPGMEPPGRRITAGAAQCMVLDIDARRRPQGTGWEVYPHGGRKATGLDAVEWAREGERLGAGEILLTSMDRDGTRDGYDLELTAAVSGAVSVPVIASGGAGSLPHLYEGLADGRAAAVLAASIFHFAIHTIAEAKAYLRERGRSEEHTSELQS